MSAQPTSFDPVDTKFDLDRRRTRLTGLAIVGLLSAAALTRSLGPAMTGEIAALGRLALGAVGLAAAMLLYARPALGYRLALGWAALQVPFVAWTPNGGSPFTQGFDLPLTFSYQTTVNDITTSYFAAGVNIVGLVALAALRSRKHALTTS